MLRLLTKYVVTSSRSCATQAHVIDSAAARTVADRVANAVADRTKRLFAVVYVNGRQWKVSEGDLISLEGNLPLTVGDHIKLDKILAVGGSDFTVFGRPMLDSSSVIVKATVVEKNAKSPELKYFHDNHTQQRQLNWLTRETTVVRINEVTATPTVATAQ